MTKPQHYITTHHTKTLLLGIHAPYNKTKNVEGYYEEFLNLVKTKGITKSESLFMKLRDIDSSYFLTKGKLDELREACLKHQIEEVIISEPLTVQQERNLTDFLDCEVSDRTKLILDIFENAAHSAEGKTQVAIARYQYEKTRLAGKGIHMSQQEGAIGLRGGPGETAKEKERRAIEQNVVKLKKQLAALEQIRETQRKKRLQSNEPHMCIIGYTNAGKSTILNALTKSNVLAENKLFATLDTTTRELYLGGKKKGTISDTVGFIQLLPPQLIEAFKSTLSELHYADLLIHVIDSTDPNWETHIAVVHDILNDLGVNKDMVYVFNKFDRVDNQEHFLTTITKYQPHVVVSALSKATLEPLTNFLQSWQRSAQQH